MRISSIRVELDSCSQEPVSRTPYNRFMYDLRHPNQKGKIQSGRVFHCLVLKEKNDFFLTLNSYGTNFRHSANAITEVSDEPGLKASIAHPKLSVDALEPEI